MAPIELPGDDVRTMLRDPLRGFLGAMETKGCSEAFAICGGNCLDLDRIGRPGFCGTWLR
jgi:hypothetical protein